MWFGILFTKFLSLSSLLASTSVGEMVKVRGKERLGEKEGVGNAIRDLGVCPLKKKIR